MTKEPTTPPKAPTIKEPTVEIGKDKLEKMMERIERLESAASKARLQNFDEKRKGETGKVVNLRVIDGKVIIGWSDMLKNIVEKSPEGFWKEDQQVEITYEDGKKQKMPYVIFTRRYTLLPLEVEKEVKNEDGTITFVGKTAEGAKYEINEKFIN